jgi:hypothetical protein
MSVRLFVAVLLAGWLAGFLAARSRLAHPLPAQLDAPRYYRLEPLPWRPDRPTAPGFEIALRENAPRIRTQG